MPLLEDDQLTSICSNISAVDTCEDISKLTLKQYYEMILRNIFVKYNKLMTNSYLIDVLDDVDDYFEIYKPSQTSLSFE